MDTAMEHEYRFENKSKNIEVFVFKPTDTPWQPPGFFQVGAAPLSPIYQFILLLKLNRPI